MTQTTSGVTFRETMKGGFALGETDPGVGADSGKAAGQTLAIHCTVTIDDIQRFISEPDHLGHLAGHVEFTPFGEPVLASAGVFNLFRPSDTPGLKLMVYELAFEHEDRPYYLAGRKEVRDDSSVDLWSDTTTLYTRLHEGSDSAGPVAGAGILSLGPTDLVRLVSTLRATGTRSKTEEAEALAAFGRFFLGELWGSYARVATG